jgi:hypothetical protein
LILLDFSGIDKLDNRARFAPVSQGGTESFTGYGLQVAGYRLQVTGHRVQVLGSLPVPLREPEMERTRGGRVLLIQAS